MSERSPGTTLTEPQIRALRYLASVDYASPAQIGQAMGGNSRKNSAQGLGRQGGMMGARLVKMGLAHNASAHRQGFPAYSINAAGRDALKECANG